MFRKTLKLFITLTILFGCCFCAKAPASGNSNTTNNLPDITGYPIAGTNQTLSYDNTGEIAAPAAGQAFYGQNAQNPGTTPHYIDNGDGTITDKVTGLMWQKTADRNGDGVINDDDKLSYYQAVDSAATCRTGGYTDWRLPTIKELYSLIVFSGVSPEADQQSVGNSIPFIDTNYFDFGYGDLAGGDRIIDAQYVTSTLYVSTTMNGSKTDFGVNFADGRIKGYPVDFSPINPNYTKKMYYVKYVRGNTSYGKNDFADNGDGTITDKATGLMWTIDDSKIGMNWENALAWVQEKNTENYFGHNDWRLPDTKELQSIVDYTRSPATTNSPAIDPAFSCTQITNEAGQTDYPYYWTSTTHCAQTSTNGIEADYFCFGRAMGYMSNLGGWLDVHGAGAQRSDPKVGNPADYPDGRGPQGDAVRIYNYVRLVRNK